MKPEQQPALESQADRPDALDKFRRWMSIAVAIAVLGWLGYAVFRGFTETANELGNFQWWIYVPVLLLTLVNYGLRFVKWHYLLGRIDITIQVVPNLWVFIAGLAMVISPFKAGELVKPYLVRVIAGAPMTKTVPVLVAERLTDGLAVIILAAIGVGYYYSEGTTLIFGTLAALLVGWVLFSIKPVALRLIQLLGQLPGIAGVASRLEEAYLATRSCLAPVPFALMLVVSLVAWWAECVGYWLVFKGMSVETTLSISTFLYAFATVFGAPSPGGMGMADLALAEGALNLIPGLTPGQAIASSLLVRIATLWLGVVMGAYALLRIDSVIKRYRS